LFNLLFCIVNYIFVGASVSPHLKMGVLDAQNFIRKIFFQKLVKKCYKKFFIFHIVYECKRDAKKRDEKQGFASIGNPPARFLKAPGFCKINIDAQKKAQKI